MNLITLLKEMRLQETASLYFFLLFGILLSGINFFDILASSNYLYNAIILHISFVLLSISFFFAMNDYFDFESDSLNKDTRNPIVRGKISKNSMLLLMIATGVVGIGLTYLINAQVFILTLMTFCAIYMYSGAPFRFKGKPITDWLMHSLPGYFLVMIGFLSFSGFEFRILYYSIIGFLICMLTCIAQQMRDYEVDKIAGLKTTVVFLGLEKSLLIFKALSLLTYIYTTFILLSISFKFAPASIALLPFMFVLLAIKKEDASVFYKKLSRITQVITAFIIVLTVIYVVL